MDPATPTSELPELRLTSRQGEIIAGYEARLRRLNSPLVADQRTLRECLFQAASIINDCAASIRSRRVIRCESAISLTCSAGTAHAVQRVHPIELIRAGSALFETVLESFTEILAGHPDQAELLATLTRTLQSAIFTRMQVDSTLYDAFLLTRIKEQQSANRRKLARAIHDQLGGSLSLAARLLELYEISAGSGEPQVQKITETRDVIVSAMETTRSLCSDLRLNDPLASIRLALKTFIKSVDSDASTVDIRVNGDEEWVPLDYRDELFLILREALRNAFTHAHADKVGVIIDIAPHEVRAIVGDQGIGFDTEAVAASRRNNGLVSMKERTELLGGTLLIASHPPYGTHVEVRIPLPEQRDADDT